ncbi:hypothetical protein O181_045835 [Austropuccinia psidii MF-1]|uniref:Uncharacterized protein n=1 Tax=Austropuccinia psidii MF-1 TaxID=1389203 RepID=A0A9Q3DS56_9BASI|nr:hypothetical protein [Austropuccinia psidii MF-1]
MIGNAPASLAVTPSISGKPPTSTQIGLIMREPSMVHIWYYIPLCTIFPQESNGDVFRTKLCHSNSSPQIHHPFQRKTSEPFSLAIPGGYQKTIQGHQPPGPEGVGFYFLSGFFQRQFQQVIKNSISCQVIKYFSIP